MSPRTYARFCDGSEGQPRVARSLGPLVSVLNPDLLVIGAEAGRTDCDVVKSPLLHALKRCTVRPALNDLEVAGATLERRTTDGHQVAPTARTPTRGEALLVHTAAAS
jgi:hypothetical protein